MSRLIDADELREDVLSWENCYNGYSDAYDKARIIDEIDEQPTVDAEPVIRCKDCKYCEDESYTDEDTGKEVKYLVCDRWYEQDDADGNMFPKADDFCSRGERK